MKSSLSADYCVDNGYVGKKAANGFERTGTTGIKIKESMDMCT